MPGMISFGENQFDLALFFLLLDKNGKMWFSKFLVKSRLRLRRKVLARVDLQLNEVLL